MWADGNGCWRKDGRPLMCEGAVEGGWGHGDSREGR